MDFKIRKAGLSDIDQLITLRIIDVTPECNDKKLSF